MSIYSLPNGRTQVLKRKNISEQLKENWNNVSLILSLSCKNWFVLNKKCYTKKLSVVKKCDKKVTKSIFLLWKEFIINLKNKKIKLFEVESSFLSNINFLLIISRLASHTRVNEKGTWHRVHQHFTETQKQATFNSILTWFDSIFHPKNAFCSRFVAKLNGSQHILNNSHCKRKIVQLKKEKRLRSVH